MNGPSWELIATGAVGLLCAFVIGYVRTLTVRVDRLDDRFTTLNTNVLRDYHSKNDLNEILGEIKSSVKALHQRFDKMESLYGR